MLIDQSSRDDILQDDKPPAETPRDAVSEKSSQDKRQKRSPEAPAIIEGSAISDNASLSLRDGQVVCPPEQRRMWRMWPPREPGQPRGRYP